MRLVKGQVSANRGTGLLGGLGPWVSGPALAVAGVTGVWIPAFAGKTVGGAGITIWDGPAPEGRMG